MVKSNDLSESNVALLVPPPGNASRDRTKRAIQPVWELRTNRGSRALPHKLHSMSNELQVGDVLDDRFKILEVVNRGGMAWIYKALDWQNGGTVVLKVPLMQFESDPGYYSRFQREESIGVTLDHPNVVKILPASPAKSRPYLVMELLEGETLAERMQREKQLPENEAVRIIGEICVGLEYLHRKGVVHRDLKPQNIMLCRDGSLRIMDFGIAKSKDARRLTFGGFSATMGTPDYIAPEQVQGKRGDARTDLYALGAMLYELTTGFPPFEGDNPFVVMNARLTGDPVAPRERNPALSREVEEIILHALERNPSDRFYSAAAMKAELEDYGSVSLTERVQHLQAPRLWKAHRPMLAKIGILLAGQVVIFLVLFWWFSHHGRHAGSTGTSRPATNNAVQGH